MERSVLEVLLAAHGRVVIALARDVGKARLPSAWRQAALKGEIAVVSVTPDVKRLTGNLARLRNDWVCKLAASTVIAYAQPGGQLEIDATRWRDEGRKIQMLMGA